MKELKPLFDPLVDRESPQEVEAWRNSDVLVVLGRGVGKDKNGNYQPTRLIGNGVGKYFGHSGQISYDSNVNSQSAVICGGNSNVLAVFHMLRKLSIEGITLPRVIFSAGRPPYLLDDPDPSISEGSVMQDKLFKLLNRHEITPPAIEVHDQNKSTIDDITSALMTCSAQNLNKVSIITVYPHLIRSWHMTKKVMADIQATLPENFEVNIIDSWAVLSDVDSRYQRILESIKSSDAFRRTATLEMRGLAALFNGVTSTQSKTQK